MLRCAILAFLATISASLAEAGSTDFDGVWGREIDCARAPLIPGGALLASPVMIQGQLLQHGLTACRLDWFRPDRRPGRVFAAARALCGEDSHRAHRLGALWENDEGGERLTLIWNEEILQGPLSRCSEALGASTARKPDG